MSASCVCDPGTVENGWMETRCDSCVEIEIRAWSRVFKVVPLVSLDESQIAHLIELRGVYDGWSVAVLKDGRRVNRWAGTEYTRRAAVVDAFLAGEEANGRWF